MPIESATYINDLAPSNPLGSDPAGQGDDHLRLIKSVMLATFPNMGAVMGKVQKLDTAQTISAGYNTGFIISSTSATATVVLTLPAAASITGGWHVQLSTQGNYAVVTPQAGASINGAATFTLPPNTNGFLVYDGGSTTFRAWKWPISAAGTKAVFEGDLQVGGIASFSTVATSGNLTVGGIASFSTVVTTGNLTVGGIASFSTVVTSGRLTVGGIASFSTVVTSGNLTIGGGVSISAAVTVAGALTVAGVSSFGAVGVKGLLDLTGLGSAGQIKFPATQNPSADANTLDDYEQGTWTPILAFDVPGTSSMSYSTRSGVYTKIGRVVHLQAGILGTMTVGTAAGGSYIGGTPFISGHATQTTGAIGAFNIQTGGTAAAPSVYMEANSGVIRPCRYESATGQTVPDGPGSYNNGAFRLEVCITHYV